MATTVSLKPNAVEISGSTSGTTTLQATAVAGTTTLTLPAATDTLVGRATTDTLTNKTLTGAVMNGTLGATTPSTGAFTTLSASGTLGVSSNVNVNSTGGTIGVYVGPSGSEASFVYNTDGNLYISPRSGFATSISGNVGIGLTNPGCKLDVVAASNTSLSPTIRVYSNNLAVNTAISYDGIQGNGDFYVGTTSAAASITFKTNNATKMTLDSSGNLLVGTTSAGAMITAKTQTASGSALATLGTSGDTSFQAILVSKFDNDSTTSQNFIQFQINNGGANCGKITANGANTAAFASTSDQRVKENIAELPSQLANIMALRPVEFDYIESYGGGHQIGFIAQEMQQVYPDAISIDDSSEQIMSVTGWSKTEARLVKAIQEQQALITQLTARITALEGA